MNADEIEIADGAARYAPGTITDLRRLAPGVLGRMDDLGPDGLRVYLLVAERPGNGDVSRFLDSLPADRRVVFGPTLSTQMAGAYARRGYVPEVDALGLTRWKKPAR